MEKMLNTLLFLEFNNFNDKNFKLSYIFKNIQFISLKK